MTRGDKTPEPQRGKRAEKYAEESLRRSFRQMLAVEDIRVKR